MYFVQPRPIIVNYSNIGFHLHRVSILAAASVREGLTDRRMSELFIHLCKLSGTSAIPTRLTIAGEC